MDLTLFWSVFAILSILYFAVAMNASKHIVTEEDYFFVGRRYGIFALTATLTATQVGAGALLGSAEEAYHAGLYGLLYNLGISIGFLILGFGFAAKLRQFQISTTAQLFELKYGSVALRRAASLLSILTLGGILAGQFLASRKLLGSFVVGYDWVLIAFWLLVIFYTMFGGTRAVVATDIFQIILIFLVFIGVLGFFIWQDGAASIIDTLNQSSHSELFKDDTINMRRLYGFLFMPLLFSLIEQDLAIRFFSARSKSIAAYAALISAVVITLFSIIPVFLGMKAKLMGFDASGASPLILTVKNTMHEAVLVMVVCALIAAIASTADSILNAISSNIMFDFNIGGLTNGNQAISVTLSRAVTLAAGVTALVVAYLSESILDLMVQSYELSVCCLFIPMFFCFFKKRFVVKSAGFAMAFGLAGFVLTRLIDTPLPRELVSVALSLIGYVVGEVIGRDSLKPSTFKA